MRLKGIFTPRPPEAEKRFSEVVPEIFGSRLATPALSTTYGVAARLCEKGMINPA